jgi:signal transduction histidine kinase
MDFIPQSIIIWVSALTAFSFATVVFFGNKKLATRAFAVLIFTHAAWMGMLAYFNFGIRLSYFLSILIVFFFVYFIEVFTSEKKIPIKFYLTLLSGALLTIYLSLYTNLITIGAIQIVNMPKELTWIWGSGPYISIYFIYLIISYCWILKRLFEFHKEQTDISARKNIMYLIIGVIIGMTIPILGSAILPFLGNYSWYWLGHASALVWVPMMTYSIIKYHQMDIKVVTAEFFVTAMTIVAFANIFIGNMLGLIGKVFIFLAFLLLGIYLIRNAIKESAQKVQLDNLNKDLQKKVEEQVKEIKASYQVERAARMELEKTDEAKNQFILITQHHLRTPVTSIKWQLESILAGNYGPVNTEFKKAIAEMNESVESLNSLINKLLSISALRVGVEALNKSQTNIRALLEEILMELKKEVDRKHIVVHTPMTREIWPNLFVDHDRMKEVLFIILENAVKYNIDGGSITINGHESDNTFVLDVENTGAELSPEDKQKIFSELFYRSDQAKSVYPVGMGIGLSMAQAVIQAHGGKISLNSRKDGGGVKVTIVLPVA